MTNYIVLDGHRYKCVFGQWLPMRIKPARVRKTLAGTTDVTYGPAVTQFWSGTLVVPHVVTDSNYGTDTDLRTTYDKLENIAFVDHVGTSCNVAMIQDLQEQPIVPVLDSDESRFLFKVMLVRI